MRSSIPAVIDALLELMGRACPGVLVVDGIPSTRMPDDIISIGGTTDNTATGTAQHVSLGRGLQREDYTVEATVSCVTGGTAQRAVRQRAFGIYDAILSALDDDPSLGGLVRIASVATLELAQTNSDDAQAGRRAEVNFTIRIQNDLRR